MRTKVYGKKSRVPPVGAFDVFTRDSPPAQAKEKESHVKIRSEERILKEKPRNVVERVTPVCKAAREESREGEDGQGLLKCKERAETTAKAPVEAEPVDAGPQAKESPKPKPRPRGRPRKSPLAAPAAADQPDVPILPSSPQASTTNLNDLAPLLQKTLTLASPTRPPTNPKPKPKTKPNTKTQHSSSSPPSLPAPSPATSLPPTPTCVPPSTLTYLTPLLTCPNTTPHPTPFPTFLPPSSSLHLSKIGEGSFGEVYRATIGASTCILKLLPLRPAHGPGARSRCFTSVHAAASEIRLLEKMQRVPGFVEFRGACVVVGAMPTPLIHEWVSYRDAGRTVGTRDPRKKGSYGNGQLWLVLEMGDAGGNLEPGCYMPPSCGRRWEGGMRYLSVKRSWDVYWQVVGAVAKAEVWAGFEHRDLHLGNLCAKEGPMPGNENEDLTLVGPEEEPRFGLRYTGVEVTVIDYSLSRAQGTGTEVLFCDFLKDEDLLRGEGDLQYDIYRYMAEAVGAGGSGEGGCGREGGVGRYVPKTNVLWLAYLIRKLLDVTQTLSEEAMRESRGKVTRVRRMRGILEGVRDMLRFEEREGWEVGSAGGLVELGVRRGWFRGEEVLGG